MFTHHLTAFLAISILAGLCLASFISKKDEDQKVNSNKTNFLLLAVLSAITAAYFLLYASPAFIVALSSSDLLTVGAYQIIVLSIIVYTIFIAKNYSRKITLVNSSIAFISAFSFILLLTQIPLISAAPILPSSYLLYALPFIIALPLIIFGLNELHQKNSSLITPLFWIMSVAAFGCYAVFANPTGSISYVSRSVDFMLPPFLILAAVGIQKLFQQGSRFKVGNTVKFVAVALVLVMVTVNTYTVYATVSMQEPYLGYFWRYDPSEYAASSWLSSNVGNQSVAGDSKVYYLSHGYFNETVNVMDGYKYLIGEGSAPELLYVYNQMSSNGYVLYQGIPYTLPANWIDKLVPYNCIYANNGVTIYARK